MAKYACLYTAKLQIITVYYVLKKIFGSNVAQNLLQDK